MTLTSACAEKGVLVVNGEFNKLIEVVQGNVLEVRNRPCLHIGAICILKIILSHEKVQLDACLMLT